jgi:hypothetical protein
MSDLRGAWEEHAAEFVAWARKPGHDSYCAAKAACRAT